ncbi:ribose ABC transporter permease [Agrobacterium leguminum]|jgi:ribose transport system permease protein|uniref:ABC transporter, Membrane component (Putative high-affinity D-ribose transport protein) n=1 Tax=Agrobacterium deltaense NCPPB 1641 TaxID=1183425 RepID=A0A1S7U5M7_9HYPH|nr:MULTISPECIES: ribose ABC transporter permease [Agrobacterium]MCZ7933146.1 ribose ABC transporter permease [Agrobacterium leguminum]WFS68827.1 ribose ABC transporter permease [Agrobacterium leguminum]CVI62127.1 ABC transporter, Membrane component (putative high-affinity D-ribose transport protein) [Agrobacterium deltaense NCPPB 1641]
MSLDANTGTAAKTGGFSLGNLLRSPLALPLAGLIVVSILMGLASDNFFSLNNIMNVLRQVSVVGILAVGMTFVILTGGIDLSVGAVMALVGTLSAGLMVNSGLPASVALPAGLFIGLGIGIFNGALVAWGKMPAIIVTLATMGMARGLGLIYSGGYPVSGIPSWISWFGVGRIGVVPVPVVIMVVIYAIAWVLLQRTAFGRHVYALGGNELAARLSGVKTQRVKLAVYGISGVTAALAALILTGRLMSGQPNAGVGFELDAIAAVVLGGTAIAGGRGLILGTLIGAVLLGILNNGLNLMGINPYLQDVIKGGIILLAIYIGREWR